MKAPAGSPEAIERVRAFIREHERRRAKPVREPPKPGEADRPESRERQAPGPDEHRGESPVRRRRADDDWSLAYDELSVERGVPDRFLRGAPTPWFEITPTNVEIHAGKVQSIAMDHPSQNDKRIEGLAHEFGKPAEPDPRFGELTARGY